MPLPKYLNWSVSNTGDVLSGITVTVTDAITGSLATVYSDSIANTVQTNPWTTEDDGSFLFYAEEGSYNVTLEDGPSNTTINAVLSEPSFVTPTELLADDVVNRTVNTYLQVERGDVTFRVAASGASDHDATTAGGVKLYAEAKALAVPLSAFGAKGDGNTNVTAMTAETTAFQNAADWASKGRGRRILVDEGATYALNSEITANTFFDLDASGAEITWHAETHGITYRAAEATLHPLTTDYTIGSTTIDVSSSPLSEAPKAGSIIKIVSDAVDPANRDSGSNSSKYRVGEFAVVGVGSSTTSIVLQRPLEYTRGVSPVSVAGEEGIINAYTTSVNARITVLNEGTCRIKGGVWGHEDGNEAGWSNANVITINGSIRPIIEDVEFRRSYDTQIRLSGTYCARVVNVRFNRGENNPGNSQLGYGVADGGYMTTIIAPFGNDMRHVYTTNAVKLSDNDSNYWRTLTAGRIVGGQIIGGHATGGTSGQWDTHHDAESTRFVGVHSSGGATRAAAIRGRHVNIDGLTARNMLNGIYAFTEYQSGDPDDDIYVSEKSADAFTSLTTYGLDIECDELPVEVSHATLHIEGSGRYITQDHCFIGATGGDVKVSGQHRMKSVAGGVSHSHTGVFSIYDPNSNATEVWGAGATVTIEAGAIVDIDATNAAAASVQAFSIEANSKLIVEGMLNIILPSGATLGDVARVECKNNGKINLSIDGAADNTLITNSDDLKNLVIEAGDGTFWWKDPVNAADDNDLFLTFTSHLSESHTGDTAPTVVYIPNGQHASAHMNADGSGAIRVKSWGRKLGAAGAGKIRITGNDDSFVDSADITDVADIWEIDVTCFFRSTGDQLYRGTITTWDGGAKTGETELLRSIEAFGFSNTDKVAIEIGVQLYDATDTFTVEGCQVWATRGGIIS